MPKAFFTFFPLLLYYFIYSALHEFLVSISLPGSIFFLLFLLLGVQILFLFVLLCTLSLKSLELE